MEKFTEETVEETASKIINLIKKNKKITVNEIAQHTGLSRRGVEWNISKLKAMGVLKRKGSTKAGHWVIIKER